MKKLIIILLFISFACMAGKLFAQMDNLPNMSAEWVRTGAHNAATDGADAAVYNPAGLPKLANGFHFNLSNQSMFRRPTHSYDFGLGSGPRSFTQNGADPFLPAFYAAWKNNFTAVFAGAYISGGGATMNYPTGSITTDLIGLQAVMSTGGAYMESHKQHIKASSMYLTYTAGAAYAISNKISFSGAIRYIDAANNAKAGMTLTSSPVDLPDMPLGLEYDETAAGVGFTIGTNFTCTENVTITARYESAVNLNFETDVITDDFGMMTDGYKSRRDLPAVFAFGAAYKLSEKLNAYGDFNYYFQKNANWDKSTAVTSEKNWTDMAGDAYTLAAALDYKVNDRITASFGGGYTDFLYADKAGYFTRAGAYEVIQDDNANINTGVTVKVLEKLRVTAGYMHTFWKDQSIDAINAQPLQVPVKATNAMDVVAIGLNFSL